MLTPPSRCALAFILVCGVGSLLNAATFREQRQQLSRAETYLKAAERLATSDRADDAKEAYEKARELVGGVAAELDEKAKSAFERTSKKLELTYGKLKQQGVELPDFQTPEAKMAPVEDRGRFNRDQVSFVRQVAPVLVAKCGNCHVDGARGQFSLASFNALMKGTPAGRVLVPGEGTGGVMMDLIESGDMPRGGLTVTPEEMSLLARWITQGAKFDGEDPDANLKNLRAGAAPAEDPPQEMARAEVTRATGNETVSFALDVAPILVDRCNNCHVVDNRGQLQFASFKQLIGSGSISPGNPDGSTLIRRLRGDEQPRMPQNADPLSDKQIATIATWIEEGARYDGAKPTDGLQRATAIVRAAKATPEELTAIRMKSADANWRLALPDESMASTTSDRFLVVGAVPKLQLESIAKQAEEASELSLKTFGQQPGSKLSKAPMTLFVFDHPVDYTEFGLMVERRELPPQMRGHARHDPVDPYACVVFDRESGEVDKLVLTQQVATLYLAESTSGGAPDWFTEGAGRVAAAKADAKNPTIEAWGDQFESALRAMNKPDDFMTGQMPPDTAGVVRYKYVSAMMGNSRAFNRLLQTTQSGEDFDAAFQKQYKATPSDIAKRWRDGLLRSGAR